MNRILLFCSLIVLIFTTKTFSQDEENYLPITAENATRLEQISVLAFDVDNNIKSLNQLMFHPANNTLYSLEFNETIRVWDITSLAFLELLSMPTEYVTSFAVSPEGDSILYGGWDFIEQPDFATLNLWDITQETNEFFLREGDDNIDHIVFNSSGDQFAATGWDDYSIRLWDIETSELIGTILSHSDVVSKIAFVDDSYLISSGRDGLVNIWNLPSLELLAKFEGYYFLLTSSNSEILIIAGHNETKNDMLFDFSTLEELGDYDIQGTPFAFNRSGDVVAVIDSVDIWLHDFNSGEKILKVGESNGHFPPPFAFSTDDKLLALQSDLGNIAIWAVTSQESE